MKKDEILAKAREEKSDEMENFIQDKSMIWIILAMFICLCVFSYTRLERNMQIEDYAATLNIAASVGCLYRFAKAKQRKNLILGIILGAAGIWFTVLYFLKYFGA